VEHLEAEQQRLVVLVQQVVLVLQVQLMEHRLQEQEVVEMVEVLEKGLVAVLEVVEPVIKVVMVEPLHKLEQSTLVVAVVEQVIRIQLLVLQVETAVAEL
tara:strand:- start:56 stop:355 length:300 start_codon:yes stop_codon:yes gene_type:complete